MIPLCYGGLLVSLPALERGRMQNCLGWVSQLGELSRPRAYVLVRVRRGSAVVISCERLAACCMCLPLIASALRSRCIAFLKAGCGYYRPRASSGNGVGYPQHRRWCSRQSICMSACILSESTQGKLFRAPSALTLACRRGACGAFAAAGICGYFPLRERMLAIMTLRPFAASYGIIRRCAAI